MSVSGELGSGYRKKAEKKTFSFGDLQVCKTWTMKKELLQWHF